MNSTSDFLTASFGNLLSSNASTQSEAESKQAAYQIKSTVASLIDTVPDELGNMDPSEVKLFKQFKVLTQQLLLSDNASGNVAGMMRMAKDGIANELDGINSDVASLGDTAKSFIGEFQNIASTSSDIASIGTRIATALPSMREKLYNAKDRTASLQARIASNKDFSKERVAALIQSLADFKNIVPDAPAFTSIMSDEYQEMPTEVDSIKTRYESVVQKATGLADFKDNLINAVKPGDIFSSNFSTLYSMFNSISGNLSSVEGAAKSGLDLKTIAGMRDAVSKANNIISTVKTLGNKQFTNQLTDIANSSTQEMMNLASNIKGAILPTGPLGGVRDQIKTMERDVKTVLKMAEGVLKGKMPDVATLGAVYNRVTSTVDSIKSGIDTFKGLINMFDPAPTADATAYMESIGKIAPAAKDAIMTSSIQQFAKALTNPQYLTSFGQSVGEIQNFLSVKGPSLTIDQSARVGQVMSFMAGQHRRVMLSASLADIPLQRSESLKSMDIFVKSVIEPMELLVKDLEKELPSV